jgi:hypothetical protein
MPADYSVFAGHGVGLRDATTGDIIAQASSAAIDFSVVLTHAQEVGGPASQRCGETHRRVNH